MSCLGIGSSILKVFSGLGDNDRGIPGYCGLDLRTLGRLAVLKVPVPYFYCEDSELVELGVTFAALGKGQKKKTLGLIDEV